MVQGPADGRENVGGGFGPNEEFGASIVLGDVAFDGCLQIDDASAGAASQAASGERREEALGGFGSEWQAAVAGDYLGDGHTGVLLHNASTGAVVEGELVNRQMQYTQVSGFGNDWPILA